MLDRTNKYCYFILAMPFSELVILGIGFIFFMLIYRYAGTLIKGLEPKTIKIINWTGFTVAVLSGIAWYYYQDNIYMFLTTAGIVVYFLFYNYTGNEE